MLVCPDRLAKDTLLVRFPHRHGGPVHDLTLRRVAGLQGGRRWRVRDLRPRQAAGQMQG